MALCRVGAMSNLLNPRPLTTHPRLPWKPSLLLKKASISGVPNYGNSTIRSSASGEAYVKYEPEQATSGPLGESYVEYQPEPVTSGPSGEAYVAYEPEPATSGPSGEAYVEYKPESPVTTEDTQSYVQSNAYEAVLTETPKIESDSQNYASEAVLTETPKVESDSQNYASEAVQTETPKIESDSQNYASEAVQTETPKIESVSQNYASEAVQTETPEIEPDTTPIKEENIDVAPYSQASKEDTPLDSQAQLSNFFDQLGIEFDSENPSSYLPYVGGAILALWLTSTVIRAVDSIPLLPKLLELVGLGYTLWFAIRYLLFKESREEIAAKIKSVKEEVLG